MYVIEQLSIVQMTIVRSPHDHFPRNWMLYLYTNVMTLLFFNHYRHACVLFILSKVFEKVMYNKLIKFLENVSISFDTVNHEILLDNNITMVFVDVLTGGLTVARLIGNNL